MHGHTHTRISIHLSTSICRSIEMHLPRDFSAFRLKRDKISEVKRKCRRGIARGIWKRVCSFSVKVVEKNISDIRARTIRSGS